ncbi:MAG: hypothetical protein ACOCVZ_09295, partial [Gemmatimonadota bacterium]
MQKTERHPQHPVDVCAIAADRAALLDEVAGREPSRGILHSWLDLVEGMASDLAREIEEGYPAVPFEADNDLHRLQAFTNAMAAVCRDGIQGSNAEYGQNMERALDVVLALASEVGGIAKALADYSTAARSGGHEDPARELFEESMLRVSPLVEAIEGAENITAAAVAVAEAAETQRARLVRLETDQTAPDLFRYEAQLSAIAAIARDMA